MHIELIQVLRCPRPHELTWLVAQTAQIRARDVESGTLGCPHCHARYPVLRGVLDLRARRDDEPLAPLEEADPETVLRIAALLGVAEVAPGGLIVLTGVHAAAAPGLAATFDGLLVLAVNPPGELGSGGGVSIVRTDGEVPLREATARGMALDGAHSAPGVLEPAVNAVAAGGRLLAPVDTVVPDALRELARDESEWLAERLSADVMVPLRRG